MSLSWKKANKYYKLLLQPNLFGMIDVICVWGRIGSNLGGYKIICCNSDRDIAYVIDSVRKRRRHRGYSDE